MRLARLENDDLGDVKISVGCDSPYLSYVSTALPVTGSMFIREEMN